jgi:hypothetical protein
MNAEIDVLEVDETLEKMLPPPGFEAYVVVETRGLLMWMKPEDMAPGETICFYDGDCREVLKPTDPGARHRFS